MAANANIRIALWWTVCIAFLIALFGVPLALRKKLEDYNFPASKLAELAGILGAFTLIVASLLLAAGEAPLAEAYVNSSEEFRPAVVAIYEWQRLTTAILFDVLGFFLLGVWIFVSSVVGFQSKGLPRGISWFGILAGVLCFSFVAGYITKIGWLGETGLGALAFLAVPAWLIWLGIFLWSGAGQEYP
jgi:hypothetical protein